jgi:putative hydrolase of the HAD superfamily
MNQALGQVNSYMSQEPGLFNVVFDLGGVLLTWKPDQIIKRIFKDREGQKIIMDKFFCHRDWIDLDRGILDREKAIERAAVRTHLDASKIKKLMELVPYSLIPIPDTLELIRSVKKNGNRVFVLSNMHIDSINFIEKKYPIWDIFDGMIISSRIQMVKPELEIYQHLLDKFDLVIDKTIFIDDVYENLEAASKLGMRIIRFENTCQCEKELKALGCI